MISGLYVNVSVVIETNPFPHPSNTSGSKAPLLQHPPQHLGGHSSVLLRWGDDVKCVPLVLWILSWVERVGHRALLDKSFRTFTSLTFFHHFQGIKKGTWNFHLEWAKALSEVPSGMVGFTNTPSSTHLSQAENTSSPGNLRKATKELPMAACC